MASVEMKGRETLKRRLVGMPAYKNRRHNPYNHLLYTHINGRPESFLQAAEEYYPARSYPIKGFVHLHWPEHQCAHPLFAYSLLKCVLFLFQCLVWKMLGNKIIWTAHNVRPHDNPHPRLLALFSSGLDLLTDGVILLSKTSRAPLYKAHPFLRNKKTAVIPHGHYRDVLRTPRTKSEARKTLQIPDEVFVFAFFGSVRDYKNVDVLIGAFKELGLDKSMLVVAGGGANPELLQKLGSLASQRPDIRLKLEFLSDEELQTVVEASDLVVLPYAQILNSGSIVYALSNNRPVLVPENPVFQELASMLPSGWIRFYEGNLTPKALHEAAACSTGTVSLELNELSWTGIAAAHLDFFGTFRSFS